MVIYACYCVIIAGKITVYYEILFTQHKKYFHYGNFYCIDALWFCCSG